MATPDRRWHERVRLASTPATSSPASRTLLLSRPPTNALTRQVYREIVAAAADIGRRDDVGAVILFGGHEIFSAGDDMPELRTLTRRRGARRPRVLPSAVDARRRDPETHRRRHHRIRAGRRADAGAGRGLADQRRQREVRGDRDPGRAGARGGGTARLARAVGLSKAKDLVFSGRFVDAKEALALGLIDEMVAPDGVYDAALAWAQRFVDDPPQVLAAAKADRLRTSR